MAAKSKKKGQVALYARTATFDSSYVGKTLDKQIERVKKYCNAKGLSIVSVYKDEGCSGSNLNRPAFQRMITDIRAGKITAVVVDDISRLSRSCGDLPGILEGLKKKGVDLISIRENCSGPITYIGAGFPSWIHARRHGARLRKSRAQVTT